MMGFYKKKAMLLFLPGFLGFLVFFVIPLIISFYYTFISNAFEKKFVGFDNYVRVFSNEYFQSALKNTFILSGVGVPLLLVFSFAVAAVFLYLGRAYHFLRLPFLLPMLLPTAGIVLIWQILFEGSQIPLLVGSQGGNRLPIYLLFIWKNCGYNIILFMAAISGVPKDCYEASSLDGCSVIKRHFYITLPLITPTLFFIIILSIVNSFKLFREIYLYYGTNYPASSLYVVQYYINNHFNKLNYQDLSTGVIIFASMVFVLVFALYRAEKRFNWE